MRSRLRSTIKWSCTLLTVLLLVMWVGSAWWWGGVDRAPASYVGMSAGRIGIGWREPWSITSMTGDWVFVRSSLRIQWWFEGRKVASGGTTFSTVLMPMWPLVVLAATPTIWIWWHDRRSPPTGCRNCGYDLRGAAHEVCPECGATPKGLTVTS